MKTLFTKRIVFALLCIILTAACVFATGSMLSYAEDGAVLGEEVDIFEEDIVSSTEEDTFEEGDEVVENDDASGADTSGGDIIGDTSFIDILGNNDGKESDEAANEEKKNDRTKFSTVFWALNSGFLKTLEVFVFTLLGAIPLGLLICFGAMSKIPVIKYPIKGIIWIIRGTPLMLQLIIIFYGPGLIFTENFWNYFKNGRLIAAIVAFVINYACYFAEIYRGGIESIAKGQYEAGAVLGMTKSQTFFRVVVAQVIKRILPSMGNEIITLVKDTSLARIIAVYEIIYEGQSFIKNGGIIWPLFATGLYYLLFSGLLTLLFGKIEKKLSHIT